MLNKKKILYVITKGNFGGAQKYVYDLATTLPKDQFEAVVACGNGGLLIERLKEANIRTIEIESLGREVEASKDFKVLKNLIKIIKEEKPDVIHLNSSKIGFLGSLAILYLKSLSIIHNTYPIPHSVFTAHNWAFNYQGNSIISNFVFYLSHYLTTLFCDTTICVSEKIKKDVSWFPFVQNKIKVIYNGISKFTTMSKEEARLVLASKEAHKIILFSLSELHQNKGVDVALRALALLPKETKEKIIYSVAGPGEERENLEKLVKELHIENIVRFLGFVPDAKKLLSGNDIFLLPSRTEAFPYVLLEAGLAGSPIISTCVGGIPEVVRDMQNGILVHPQNPKEIAEAILFFMDHPKKQKEFGGEIKKTVSTFFTLDKMVQETIRVYELKN